MKVMYEIMTIGCNHHFFREKIRGKRANRMLLASIYYAVNVTDLYMLKTTQEGFIPEEEIYESPSFIMSSIPYFLCRVRSNINEPTRVGIAMFIIQIMRLI